MSKSNRAPVSSCRRLMVAPPVPLITYMPRWPSSMHSDASPWMETFTISSAIEICSLVPLMVTMPSSHDTSSLAPLSLVIQRILLPPFPSKAGALLPTVITSDLKLDNSSARLSRMCWTIPAAFLIESGNPEILHRVVPFSMSRRAPLSTVICRIFAPALPITVPKESPKSRSREPSSSSSTSNSLTDSPVHIFASFLKPLLGTVVHSSEGLGGGIGSAIGTGAAVSALTFATLTGAAANAAAFFSSFFSLFFFALLVFISSHCSSCVSGAGVG
mmetsp:Transcript_2452/g.3392  ORF Transcript_2452/g.3392 Transcript_2452/m.3392 type:complete len:274 (-) Transcript_2452:615-1436(-)